MLKKILKLLPAVLIVTACGIYDHGTPVRTSTVFEKGEGGVHTYRIPAIVKSKAGTLLAFAEARHNGAGDSGDISLVVKRSVDNGRNWGPAINVWADRGNVCGNPVPVVLRSGRILLICTWNKGSDHEMAIHRRESEDTRRVFCIHSDDDGISWSEPEEITAQVKDPEGTWYATGPCHGLLTSENMIVIPCNHGVYNDGPKGTAGHIIYSTDEGRSWSIGAVYDTGNESTVSEMRDGNLLLNMREWYPDGRERHGKRISAFISPDGSADPQGTWFNGGLTDPNCQGSQINNRRGQLYFSNPDTASERRNLTIRKDSGFGQTWIKYCTVTEGPAAYSDLVILRQPFLLLKQTTGIIYEAGVQNPYERIDFTVVR